MKPRIRNVEPATTASSYAMDHVDPRDVDIAWEFEEIAGAEFEPREVARRDWRFWLGIVLAVGLASVGFLGRFQTGGAALSEHPAAAAQGRSAPPTVADTVSSDQPFTITSPADGATMEGAVIRVQGVARGTIGTVQLGVTVGDALLGWATVDAEAGGPVAVVMPVFAPPVKVEVTLRAAVVSTTAGVPHTASDLEPTASSRRTFWLRPRGPIGLWPAAITGSGAGTIVVVSGCAPVSVGRLEVRLLDRDGQLLAKSLTRVRRDDRLPGAAGGYALGLGTFQVRMTPSQAVGDEPLRVDVDWWDSVSGEWGTSTATIVPAVLGHAGT
jgi:hypothetical protein